MKPPCEYQKEHTVDQRSQRGKRMELIRQGIREKVEKEFKKLSNNSQGNQFNAWKTLCWRDVYSTAQYFQDTLLDQPFTIKQELCGEVNGFGTGLTVWPAACMLLKQMEYRYTHEENNSLHGKYVVELGSGTGAVGIAAARLGAKRVVLTDMENLIPFMKMNVEEQQKHSTEQLNIEVIALEWGQDVPTIIIPANASDEDYPDIIYISDCILPKLYPIEPLVEAIVQLSRIHTVIWISYEARYFPVFDPKEKFWSLMQQRGFILRAIDENEYHPMYKAEDIEIWEVKLAKVNGK